MLLNAHFSGGMKHVAVRYVVRGKIIVDPNSMAIAICLSVCVCEREELGLVFV